MEDFEFCNTPNTHEGGLILNFSPFDEFDSVAAIHINEAGESISVFLWGSTMEKRKQHLVSWKRVCIPKKEGGLGIRMAADMNKALIAKVGWRLLNDQVSLWSRVIRSKYKVGEIHDPRELVIDYAKYRSRAAGGSNAGNQLGNRRWQAYTVLER